MYLLLLLGLRDVIIITVLAILLACIVPRRPGWREQIRYIVLTPVVSLLLAFGIHIAVILAVQAVEALQVRQVVEQSVPAAPTATPCFGPTGCGRPEHRA